MYKSISVMWFIMVTKTEVAQPFVFSEWFSVTLADCVGIGIVQAAIRNIHKNSITEDEGVIGE